MYEKLAGRIEYIGGIFKLSLLKILQFSSFVPLPVRYLFSDFAAFFALLIFHSKRKAVRKNLKMVFGRQPRHSEILKVFSEYGRYWAELPAINRFWAHHKKIIHGNPPVESCFLGLTFHIGNFEVFGNILNPICKGRFHVVAERLKPQFIADFFTRLRQNHYICSIAHDDLRHILKVLSDNKPLGILCDRMVGGRGVEVRLFGRRIQMPLNIIEYALQKAIPVYISYCVRDKDGLHIYFRKPDPLAGFDGVVKEVVASLENALSSYPYQWHVLTEI